MLHQDNHCNLRVLKGSKGDKPGMVPEFPSHAVHVPLLEILGQLDDLSRPCLASHFKLFQRAGRSRPMGVVDRSPESFPDGLEVYLRDIRLSSRGGYSLNFFP
jgi:hypothetical protein